MAQAHGHGPQEVRQDSERLVVDTYLSSGKDFMAKEKPEFNTISGAIAYRSPLGNDVEVHLKGKVIPNDYAHNPLKRETIEKLESALFG